MGDKKTYRVTWAIEIDARSPEEAALLALRIQRDTESMATAFDVSDEDGSGTHVDLDRTETLQKALNPDRDAE